MSHPKRRDTIRHLSHPQRLRESVSITGPFLNRNSLISGLQVALVQGLVLPVMLLSPRPDLIGYASLGALVALFGRFAPKGKRPAILALAALVLVGMVMTLSFAAWTGAALSLRLALLGPLTMAAALAVSAWSFGPPGVLIFLFAGAATLGPVADLVVLFERGAVVALVAAIAWVLCWLTEGLRDEAVLLPAPPPLRDQLMIAMRIGFGATVTALFAERIGLSHPAWAAMGAVAVMQSAQLHQTLARVLQRVGGNIIGAAMAWAVLVNDPSPWVVIALLLLCIMATELLIGANYGLGQMMVTPMALLMTYLALQGAAGAEMAPERVIDTVFGCAVGLFLAILLSSKGERSFLAAHHEKSRGR